jgi:hypothetical protein
VKHDTPLRIEDPRLDGWRPSRRLLVPATWEFKVEAIRLSEEGGKFDNRDRLFVWTLVRDGPNGSWEPGPIYDYMRLTPHELPTLGDALEYVARELDAAEILPAVEALEGAGQGSPNARPTNKAGVVLSRNELRLAGFLQRHLSAVESALQEALPNGSAQVEWRALAAGRAAAEQAYELGRIIREAELKAAYEPAAVRGEVDLGHKRAGAHEANKIRRGLKDQRRELVKRVAQGKLDHGGLPDGYKTWQAGVLATEVLEAWPEIIDPETKEPVRRPAHSTIETDLRELFPERFPSRVRKER